MTGRRQGMCSLMRSVAVPAAMLTAVLVAGCSGGLPSLPKVGDLNPFKEKNDTSARQARFHPACCRKDPR